MLILMQILPAHLHLKMLMECHQLISQELFLSTNTQSVLIFQKTFVISALDHLKTKKFNLFKKIMCQFLSQRSANKITLILSILQLKIILNLLEKKINTGSRSIQIALMQTSSNLQEQLKVMESLLNLLTNSLKKWYQKLLEWI